MGAVYEATHVALSKPRRGQGAARQVPRSPGGGAAPGARGAAGVVDPPRAHRRHHRLGRDRGRAHLRRHGAPRRAEPGRAAPARGRAARGARHRDRAAGGVGARRGARARHRPPRRQAGEHVSRRPRRARLRQGARLRHLQDAQARRHATSDVAASSRTPAWCWARRSTCRPSRRAATRISITASTSTRSA